MSQQEDSIGHAAARRRNDDITDMPTTPHSIIWQYTSPHYEAESSLSSLSLVASNAVARSKPARKTIDEIDTQPPRKQRRLIDEIDTQPPRKQMWLERGYAAATTPPVVPKAPVARPGGHSSQPSHASWTAGQGANSSYARRIVEPEGKRGRARSGQRPFDSLRWWLLYPGRIEFLLWVMGAMLLIAFSVLLLPLAVFSVMTPGTGSASVAKGSPAADTTVTSLCVVNQQGSSACDAVRVTSPTGLEITLLNTGQVQNGAPLQLQGRGFTALSQVSFTCDTRWQCRPASLQVDAHGTFFAKLMPEGETNWVQGWHQIVVNDMGTRHSVSLPFTLLTAAPLPDATAAIQEEATQTGTPAAPTPVTMTPSASPIDTPTTQVAPSS